MNRKQTNMFFQCVYVTRWSHPKIGLGDDFGETPRDLATFSVTFARKYKFQKNLFPRLCDSYLRKYPEYSVNCRE